MIPIWFFIGILLAFYGVLITASGLYHWKTPPANIAMSHVHADVWWGALILILGTFYTLRFRPGAVRATKEQETTIATRFE
jgi:hypothetical protein